MSKTNINPNENPIRRQSSLGGNVQFRDTGNLTENYGIFLAYVTHVYYQTGMIDFDTRDTLENVVNTNLAGGVGQAPIPVETFGTNADGKVYGNYRPINVGDKVAIAYINGDRHSPLVLGVYPKNSDSYELVSPAVYNKAGKLTEETQTTALAERKIYPSQQLYYQSGKGDILHSLGGKSFLAISEDELDLTQDLDYAYDAVGAFYDNAGEQLTSSQQKAQAWVLVHEDNPEASNADGHRTRFYVAKDGTMQIVFTNDNQLGILILEGSLDKGFTITKQYDTKVVDPKDGDDNSSKYVSLNVGGEAGFNLDVQGVSGGLSHSAKNGTNFQVRTDDLYIDNVSLTELIGENTDDIQHIIDQNQKYNKEYFDQLDKDTKHAGQVARDAAEDAAKAGSRAHDAGEKAKRTAKDIKNRIMYYMNISPEEDVYVPNKYLIIHTDTFIEDATIKKGMIDDLAVGTAQIAYEAVGTAEIEDLAVETGKIKNLAVTDEKVGELTFSHMIGETIDANTINVVNLHGENITAGTITADKIIINGLGDLSHHLGDITDGHIHAGDGGVDIDDLPADDPDQWTPFKKAWLKQQIAILEAEANSSIQYGENVGISADKVAQAKDNLINGTAPLLTNMTKTERFSMKTIQAWMDAVKQAVEDFKNLSMNSLHRKIGETVSGNSIYQGSEEPEGEMHLGDMWFKEHEDGTTETLVYGENGWYSPNDYTVSQVQDQVSKLPNSYYQADEPQGELKKDDVWYQTDTDSNGNLIYKQYRYDGKKWQPLLDDNANKNTSNSSAPANPHDGDFWTNTTTNELNQWSDSKHDWVVIPTQGPQGVPGNDGQSTYFHIAYADDIQGNGFSQTPGNKKYIGTYVDNREHDSENKADYSWNKVQGDQGKDGTDGIAGVNGVDGKTSYFHIAYADKEDGTGFSQEPANKRFMGTYVDFTQKDSIDPNKYNWTLIKGTDGANGKDGVNGSSSYIHTAYAKSSDGKDGFSTSYFKGAPYIGIVTDYVKEDPTSYTSYNWSRLTGTDGTNGTNGAPGKDGEDGTTYYVHFAYANSADGKDKFSTSEFANALYIGILTNSTQEDSTKYTDYTWSRLRGQDGSNGRDGTPGTNGKNGVSSYIHVAYANSADGKTGFSTEDASGKKYIGTYTDMVESDSVDPTKYNWTLIKGTDGTNGTNGIDGKPGADGKTPYVHFAYANSADGKTDFSTTYFNNALFVGTLTNYTQADSTKYTDYTWSRLRGQDGTQGPAGADGTNGKDGSDGKTYYTWIKFATSASGANMSDVPAGMSYIGFAYNKTTATESSVATDYKWTKFVGDDGKPGTNGKNGSQGVKGDPGKDGRPSYTWVKYADSPTSGMSDDPTNKEYMGISTNHDTATESTKYTDYSWVRLYDKSKKRNFTGTPTTPYDVGDTWTQSGATLYCIKARQSGAFSASDWNTQQITLTSLDTALQQQVKAGTDAKDGLDNLQVGGTNLLRNTDFNPFTTPWFYAESVASMEGNAEVPIGVPSSNKTILIRSKVALEGNGSKDSTKGIMYSAPNVKARIVYTFSAWVRASVSEPSSKWVVESNGERFYFDIMPGEWQRVSGQITFQTDKRTLHIYQATTGTARLLCISSPKLEQGTKATDWTPAPEDMATVTGVSNKIDNLQVGARNLIENSQPTDNSGWFFSSGGTNDYKVVDGQYIELTRTGGSYHQINRQYQNDKDGWYSEIKPGDQFAISIDISMTTVPAVDSNVYGQLRLNAGHTFNSIKKNWNLKDIIKKANTWYRVSAVTDIPDNWETDFTKATMARFLIESQSGSDTDVIRIRNIKLEKGNKATDWTPAPEDLVSQNKPYKGVTINENGLTATAGSTQVALNSSDGFLIKKGSSTLFNADKSGNLNMKGNITAGNISGVNFTGNNLTLAGSLKTTGSLMSGNGKVTLSNTGLNIKGAGLTIGDSSGKTTTTISEDGTFTANKAVLSGSLTSNSVNITGGTINMNGGKFSVDRSGNVTAKSFTSDSLFNNGTIDFKNMTVKSLSADYIVGGTIDANQINISGSIKSTNDNLDIDIDNGKMAIVNSIGDGFRFEDGKLYLTSKSWDANQSKPDYGYISYANSFLSNVQGMQIAGTDGIAVTAGGYDDFKGFIPYRPKSGSALSLRENEALLNARNQVRIEGGAEYPDILMPARPAIVVGGKNGENSETYQEPKPDVGGPDLFMKANKITLQGGEYPNSALDNPVASQFADLNISNDGRGYIASKAIYNRTYSNSPNMFITVYGTLGRSTSASKYKLNISDVYNLTEKAQTFLAVKPKQWFDKQETQEFADILMGTDMIQESPTVNPHVGFIAEDLAVAGLNEFISYGADGSLEGIQYDRLPVLHHELLRQAYNKIDYLMTQLNIMDKRIRKLEGEN